MGYFNQKRPIKPSSGRHGDHKKGDQTLTRRRTQSLLKCQNETYCVSCVGDCNLYIFKKNNFLVSFLVASLLWALSHQLDTMFYCRRPAWALARSFQAVKRKRSDARKETRGHSSLSTVICSLAGELATFFGGPEGWCFPSEGRIYWDSSNKDQLKSRRNHTQKLFFYGFFYLSSTSQH